MAARVHVLLYSTLLSVGLFMFVSADHKNITVEPGLNVTLLCRAPNNNIPIVVVECSRDDLEPEYVFLYRDGHIHTDNQHQSFMDQVDLQHRQDGEVCVILKNVKINYTGTYKCCIIQRESNHTKGPDLMPEDICVIDLRVVSPGQSGGQRKDDSLGLILGLLFPVFALIAVFFYLFFIKKQQSRGSYQLPSIHESIEMSQNTVSVSLSGPEERQMTEEQMETEDAEHPADAQ